MKKIINEILNGKSPREVLLKETEQPKIRKMTCLDCGDSWTSEEYEDECVSCGSKNVKRESNIDYGEEVVRTF